LLENDSSLHIPWDDPENITTHAKMLAEKTSQAVKSSKNLLIENVLLIPALVCASLAHSP